MAEQPKKVVSCDGCKHNVRHYCDGYVYKNWSGKFNGDPATLPSVPDQTKFWTYQTCKKSTPKLMHLNLDGQCKLFQQR